MKKFLCLILVLAMSCTLFACKSKDVTAVEEQITALGTITLESGNAISEAEAAFSALTAKDKTSVVNAADLAAARTEYQHLLYREKADELEELIHSLRPITINSAEALEDADNQYNSADINVKLQVENLSELSNSFQLYRFLRIDEVEKTITAIGEVTLESGPAIEKAEAALAELSSEDQDWVYNTYILNQAKRDFKALQEEAENPDAETTEAK